MSIVVIGSVTWDVAAFASRLPKPGETLIGDRYAVGLGGKGANQAAAAARLGQPARFFGRVGDDGFGASVRQALADHGVDPGDLAIDLAATALGVILISQNGQNAIIQAPGANRSLTAADVARAAPAIGQARAVLMQLEVPLEVSLAAASLARQSGALAIFDPAPAPQDGLAGSVLMAFDIVTPNEVEAETYCGFRPTDVESGRAAARRLVELGAPAAIVTLGAGGAAWASDMARDGACEGFQPAFKVAAIDAVGAGDCFNGALAVALTEGQPFAAAIRFAAAAAALSTTRPTAAASMPDRAETDALLRA